MNQEQQTADPEQQTTTGASGEVDQQQPGGNQQSDAGEKTFSQAEVTKMMAREKSQGRSAMLRELGIDPKDSNAIDEVKKYLHSKKPEAQVLAEQQIEQQRKIDEANQRAFLAEVKAELMQSGVQASCLDDAMALLTTKVQVADDSSEISAVIETLKTKYPVWFTNAETKPEGLKGTGSPIKPGSSSSPKQDDLGKRLAEQRKSSSVKAKHWGA